jgi:hypothetical protein
MSAAFDLLDKTILIPKLRAHGFPEKIISIYQDFLSDRKAVVQVGDTYSVTFNLEVGCVLGSKYLQLEIEGSVLSSRQVESSRVKFI